WNCVKPARRYSLWNGRRSRKLISDSRVNARPVSNLYSQGESCFLRIGRSPMKLAVCGLTILVAAIPCALAAEVSGTWEGTLQHGSEKIHAGFDLETSGGKISGDAFIEGWGYSLVSDGRLDGEHVRFTVDRKFTGDGPITKIEFEGVLSAHSMT